MHLPESVRRSPPSRHRHGPHSARRYWRPPAPAAWLELVPRSQSTSGARSRSNIHSASPSVHMFLQRSASLLPRPKGLTASSGQRGDVERQHLPFRQAAVVERTDGIFGLFQVASGKLAGVGDDQPARFQRASTLTFNAAGFIATRTSGASPAVVISLDPKLIWNAETPNNVPCGARISAGKIGERSPDRCPRARWTK